MSIFKEYSFLSASNNNICLSQFPNDNVNFDLTLNGNLGNIITNSINFLDELNFIPRITFTSAGNLSGINFKIDGFNNGVPISETIVGPNANTVTSVNCFDKITKISYNAIDNFIAVSVGTSGVGYFPLIRLNTLKNNVTNLNYALNMMVAAANPATYQIFLSLKDSYNQGTYDNLTTVNNNFIAPAAASNVSALLQYNQLASNILIKVTPNVNGTPIKAQFMQL
jgi:hypothetical protein